MKKGILVVSFGSTYRETREKNLDAIEQFLREQHPECSVYRAYTSRRICQRLREKEQIFVDDIPTALNRMRADGITHGYVQPTHIIDGRENQKAREIVAQYKEEFVRLRMAAPLLSEKKDYERVVEAVCQRYETDGQSNAQENHLLLLMGHGSQGMEGECYQKLQAAFWRAGHKNIFIATVENGKAIDTTLWQMEGIPYKKVILAPFMMVAGAHAHRDMTGGRESFLGRLQRLGYEVEVRMEGLGENPMIRDIFLEHLDAWMALDIKCS